MSYIYGATILDVSRSQQTYPCPRWDSNPRSQQVSGHPADCPSVHMKCSDVNWSDLCEVVLFSSDVKWATEKFLGTKLQCTLRWPCTEGTWLYCDYFIWCISCTMVDLTCFLMCGWGYVGCFGNVCGCFGNVCTCIYCVLYFCTVFLYCFICVYLFLIVLSVLV